MYLVDLHQQLVLSHAGHSSIPPDVTSHTQAGAEAVAERVNINKKLGKLRKGHLV